MTSKQVTSPPWNSRRLVHSKEMVWASRWSVALRTFYRQILSLLYSSFFFWNFRPRFGSVSQPVSQSVSQSLSLYVCLHVCFFSFFFSVSQSVCISVCLIACMHVSMFSSSPQVCWRWNWASTIVDAGGGLDQCLWQPWRQLEMREWKWDHLSGSRCSLGNKETPPNLRTLQVMSLWRSRLGTVYCEILFSLKWLVVIECHTT